MAELKMGCGGCGCDTFKLRAARDRHCIIAICTKCKSRTFIRQMPAKLECTWPSNVDPDERDGEGILALSGD